jgi:hypothetical protein
MRPAVSAWVMAILLASCAPATKDWYKSFDSGRAFKHVRKQVEFGPRPSGSPELAATADWIEKELKGYGLRVHRHEFEVPDTARGNVRFCNIIATTGAWPPQRDVVLLASHYDTKWLPKMHFVGANDAASSTGCLLEIARVLSRVRSGRDFAVVFFDGEEAFLEYTKHDGLFGSRRLSSDMKADGSLDRVRALILMDMIGDADLKLTIPTGDPGLSRAVFEAAESLGWRDHFSLMGAPLIDDHHPFALLGVPAIDLIDFEFGPGNSHWHTEEDTIEKVSPQSLEVVGKTVLKLLESMPR